MEKSIQVRVGWIIISLIVGFAFPISFLLAAGLAFSIYEELSESEPETLKTSASPNNYLKVENLTSNDVGWLDQFRSLCESPAEVAFLDAMVRYFDLQPHRGALKGNGLSLRLQVTVPPYRFDFLVNQRLIVEVDGAAWHTSAEAIMRDKARDIESYKMGYEVLRIPAKTTLYNPQETIKLVQSACLDTVKKDVEIVSEVSNKNAQKANLRKGLLRPANLLKSVNASLDSFDGFLNEFNHKMVVFQSRSKGECEVQELWAQQRKTIESIRELAIVKLDVEKTYNEHPENSELIKHYLEEFKINSSEKPKTGIDYANILDEVNFSFAFFENDDEILNNSRATTARYEGRENAIQTYKEYMLSFKTDLNKNQKLAKKFKEICEEYADNERQV